MASASITVGKLIEQSGIQYDGFNTPTGRKLFQELFWALTLDLTLELLGISDSESVVFVGSEKLPFNISSEQKKSFSKEIGLHSEIKPRLKEILKIILFHKALPTEEKIRYEIREEEVDGNFVGLTCLNIHFAAQKKTTFDYNFMEFTKSAQAVSDWLKLPTFEESQIARELFTLAGSGLRYTNMLFEIPYQAYFRKLEEKIKQAKNDSPEKLIVSFEYSLESKDIATSPVNEIASNLAAEGEYALLERASGIIKEIAAYKKTTDPEEAIRVLDGAQASLHEIVKDAHGLLKENSQRQTTVKELRRELISLREKFENQKNQDIFKEMLASLLEPILVEQDSSVTANDHFNSTINGWRTDGVIETFGDIGKMIDCSLPHRDYELDSRIRLNRLESFSKKFLIQRPGLRVNGITIMPAIVEPE